MITHRIPCFGIAVLVATTAFAEQDMNGFALRPGCVLPYAAIAPASDPFSSCDNAGRMRGSPLPSLTERLQSVAKNNLCSDATSPVPLRHSQLTELPQPKPADIARSRMSLRELTTISGRRIGEGTVIQMTGIIEKASVRNCRSAAAGELPGDAVNCHVLGGLATSEVALRMRPLESKAGSSCEIAIANVVPHFRPVAWSNLDLKTPVPPVRITGQLYYDAAGDGCKWEVHPVYGIDVCTETDARKCDGAGNSAWLPYDQWVRQPAAATRSTGQDERTTCDIVSLEWKQNPQAQVVSYDAFLKLAPPQRNRTFQSLSPEQKATLKRTHAQRWLELHQSELTADQRAAVRQAIDFISPDLYRNPSDPTFRRQEDEIRNRLSCSIGRARVQEAFTFLGPPGDQTLLDAIDGWLTRFSDCLK